MEQEHRKLFVAVALISLVFLFGGCRSRMGDYTVLTTKNIDLTSFSSHSDSTGTPVEGVDEKHIIFVFPTGIPNIKEAVDDALEKGNAYMLTDAVLYYEYFYIPYIYGNSKYVVKGIPIR